MKVIGLDGKVYKWSFLGCDSQRVDCSSYHDQARQLLQEEFPLCLILEEVSIPGAGSILFADFYLPLKRLMIEVQGQQHYEHSAHFHGVGKVGKSKFLQGQNRDRKKAEWCELNAITLITLSWEDNIDVWRSQIRRR